ncbi:MAG TPA: DsbA family protein [Bryobacteraceae bacterium]|nr:DsbA family protein [Bryobacteraceae bacterium]
MVRTLFASIAAALMLVAVMGAQGDKKSAFNKAELETYVRHLWVIPPTMGVTIGDPTASDVPGLQEVRVKITQGQASQEVPLYVTKDGGKIIQGNAYDVNFNPFKKDLEKLKTQFQPSLGTPGATVVLVLFSDMQCPFCKQEAQMLRQNLIANYPTQVRLYFIDFPIESLHPWAKSAAIAGRCVFRQDPKAFWEYHDWMYGHQESTTPDNLKEIIGIWAKDRKDIDFLQLTQCMDAKATEAEVKNEQAEGAALGVEGTPTLFVNGRRMVNSVEWPSLKAVIDNEIEYQKIAKNAGEDCGCDLQLSVPGLPQQGTSPVKKK